MSRRAALRTLVALPAAAAVVPPAHARDYASAVEVLRTIEALSAEVEARLPLVAGTMPQGAAFASSAKADLERHRRERARLPEARHHAVPPLDLAPLDEPASLARLRAVLEQLMHAHAEGLPALERGASVQRLAEHMLDVSRLLTVVDLWIDEESERE